MRYDFFSLVSILLTFNIYNIIENEVVYNYLL